MRYATWYKSKEEDSGLRARSSGGVIANCQLQIADCKLRAAGWHWRFASADENQHGQDARATRASGFLQQSAFNIQHSSTRPHPLPKGEGTRFFLASSRLRPPVSGLQPPVTGLQPPAYSLQSSRRGVTLIEMLIVIFIIMILAVATLKVIQPLGERRVREAARAVNVYISSARNRAIEIGRPCGVIFHRANGTNFPSASTVLDQCEVPLPFSGDTTNAAVMVQNWTYRPDFWTDGNGVNHYWPYWDNKTSNPPPMLKTLVLKVQVRLGAIPNLLIKYGDKMQLNGQGPYYVIVRDPGNPSDSDYRRTTPPYPTMDPPNTPKIYDFPIDTANGDYIIFDDNDTLIKDNNLDGYIDTHYLTLALYTQSTPMQAVSWPKFGGGWSNPVPFQILRQPVKSSASSLQLPAGSVVDLDFSGTDYTLFTNSPNGADVAVIFSSNGALEGYYWNNQPFPALGPIFMLIGSRSRVRDFVAQPLTVVPNLNDLPNWAELSNIWVTINYQTGMVSTDDNFAINFATQKDSAGNIINWTIAPNWDWIIAPNISNWPFFINLSRTYARESQSMGGR